MNTVGTLGVWRSDSVTTAYGSTQRVNHTGMPPQPLDESISLITSPIGAAPAVDAREQIRTAVAAFASALQSFSREHRAILVQTTVTTEGKAGAATGRSARLTPVIAPFASLRTTRSINTQLSTDRSSTSALNLSLESAPSLLSSAPLGLDLQSPEERSLLESLSLGLDLTSADAPSTLASATPLGLDLTSPEVASTLSSGAALGLNLAGAASTTQSTAAMSTAATAYSSSSLSFSGSTGQASTSGASLTGTYTGINGASAASELNVIITRTATLNGLLPTRVEFEVRDQADKLLFSYDGNLRSGDEVSLGADIGLKISFSSGRLTNRHSASTSVIHNPAADVHAAFNASASQRPRFDGNAQVTAGSFTVNGTTISVHGDDSISSVLARITASAAGVRAEVGNGRVTLVSQTDSERDIVLGADTSGFLSATKLAGAVTVRGNVADDQQVMAQTARFAGIATGTFTINGAAITLNRETDTLRSVMDRINGSSAGVTASYDPVTDRVTLRTLGSSEDLITVGGDSTGFLAAAGLTSANTVRGNIRDDRQVLNKTARFGGVTSGWFSINGESIAVDAESDTLHSLLAKIDASAAGVTAAYDPADGKLRLTGRRASQDLIVVGADTTGFLSAAGLSTGNTMRGHMRQDQVALRNLAGFQSVADGAFTIDGRRIAVDTATDTIESLVARINHSGARVSARYDARLDRLVLETTAASEDNLSIGSDTSGFTTVAGLDPLRTTRGNIRDDRQILAKTAQFAGVVSGSLTLEGEEVSIDVNRDTLASVIDKLNAAGVGVTARLDAAGDRIELVTDDASERAIGIGDDTTGFLAAAGLTGAATVRGSVADDRQRLSETARFAAVRNGAFTVNGMTIRVDTGEDSLRTVLERINRAGAGINAEYDAATDRLHFTPLVAGATVSLDNDTTGFLAAANVETGTIGTRVDPSAAFNATGLRGPGFDPGFAVEAGSFVVNGVTIEVRASDSIHSVLARLTASPAGVNARYDEVSGTVALTAKRTSDGAITVGDDTSGFLAAVKLDGTAAASIGAGTASPYDTALALMPQYASVASGTILADGHTIAVDPSTSTLRGVITALNDAGVRASLDEHSGRLKVAALAAGSSLDLSDTSGLLRALGIAPGTYQGVNPETRASESPIGSRRVANTSDIVAAVAAAIESLNAGLSQLGDDPDRLRIEAAIQQAVAALDGSNSGLRIGTSGRDLAVTLDPDALSRRLEEHAGDSIDSTLDALVGDLLRTTSAAIDRTDPSERSTSPLLLDDRTRAQLRASQAAASLLTQRPMVQLGAPDAVTIKRALDAYSDKTAFFAGLSQALSPAPDTTVRPLLDALDHLRSLDDDPVDSEADAADASLQPPAADPFDGAGPGSRVVPGTDMSGLHDSQPPTRQHAAASSVHRAYADRDDVFATFLSPLFAGR